MPTSIVPSRLGEILDNLGYIALGFGISLSLLVALLGFVFKFISEKIKTDRLEYNALQSEVTRLRQDVALLRQEVDNINDHEDGRASFTKGLYSVSEKLTASDVVLQRMKEDLRDLWDRCERRHVVPAKFNRRSNDDSNTNEQDDIEIGR